MAAVPSDHRFDDPEWVRRWADGINERRPWRAAVFSLMADRLISHAPNGARRVLEVGSGPGLLAEHLLDAVPIVEYTLFDFSGPMHQLARERLAAHTGRTRQLTGDFLAPGWTAVLDGPYDAVVTLQAVHELRDAALVPALYRQLHGLLSPRGLFLNADLVNGTGRSEGHLLTTDEHIDALRHAGFADPAVLAVHDDLGVLGARRD
jgi:SAM-dependent methyltransferase